MARLRLGGYVDLSTVDWHGHLTSMLFFAGCNLACSFCQNAPLIPVGSGEEVDLEEVKKLVLKGFRVLDAVGFSGGEPTLQGRSLKEICVWAKGKGLKTFLNTNGTNPRLVTELLEQNLLSYVALDVKAPLDEEIYGRVTGKPWFGVETVEAVRDTLKTCINFKVPFEVRTTVVPTLIECEDDIGRIAREIRERCPIYVLQQFIPSNDVLDPRLRIVPPTSRETLLRLAQVAKREGISKVFIRTKDYGLESV